MHEIVANVFLGSAEDVAEDALLEGINRIVQVAPNFTQDRSEIKYLCIPILDEDEEDLLSHLPSAVAFIEEAVQSSEGVLVHCQAGVSRSVSVIVAYLIKSKGKTLDEFLAFIQSISPSASPNDGFLLQLQLWEEMGGILDAQHNGYKQFKLTRMQRRWQEMGTVDLKGLAAHDVASMKGRIFKCRKCRKIVADDSRIVSHEPGTGQTAFSYYKRDAAYRTHTADSNACTSYFVEPLLWMQNELESGEVEGKLTCVSCQAKLGAFNWSGLQCSCGAWVAPAFSIHKKQVDVALPR